MHRLQVPVFMANGVPADDNDLRLLFWLMSVLQVICLYYAYFVSPVQLFCSPCTIQLDLPRKDGTSQRVSLYELMKQKCPRLTSSVETSSFFFHPSPLLPTGHLQTVAASLFSKYSVPRVTYERELVDLPDGGSIALDWSPGLPTQHDTTPVVLVIHGLSGGSEESYIQDTIYALTHPSEEFSHDEVMRSKPALRCVAFNFRGCSNTRIRTPRLYCAAYTEDLRWSVQHIQRKVPPGTPLIAIGFSMGANVLMKYVGEEKDSCILSACISIANPYDLLGCSRSLHRSLLGTYLYSAKMTSNMLKMLRRHWDQFRGLEHLNESQILSARTLTEFDEAFTRRSFSYRTVHEYYRHGSCAPYLPDIHVPTLLLSALDDPICDKEVIPFHEIKANPNLILALTATGGHIGYFEGGLSYVLGFTSRPSRWFPKPVAEFVHCMLSVKNPTLKSKKEVIKHESVNIQKSSFFVQERKPFSIQRILKGRYVVMFVLLVLARFLGMNRQLVKWGLKRIKERIHPIWFHMGR